MRCLMVSDPEAQFFRLVLHPLITSVDQGTLKCNHPIGVAGALVTQQPKE